MYISTHTFKMAAFGAALAVLGACSGSMEAAKLEALTQTEGRGDLPEAVEVASEPAASLSDQELVETVLKKLEEGSAEGEFSLQEYESFSSRSFSHWMAESLLAADIVEGEARAESRAHFNMLFSEMFVSDVLGGGALMGQEQGQPLTEDLDVAPVDDQASAIFTEVGEECTDELATRCVIVRSAYWQAQDLKGLLVLLSRFNPDTQETELFTYSQEDQSFMALMGIGEYIQNVESEVALRSQEELVMSCATDPLQAPVSCLEVLDTTAATIEQLVIQACSTGRAEGLTASQCELRFDLYCSAEAIASSDVPEVQEQVCAQMGETLEQDAALLEQRAAHPGDAELF